MNQFDQSVNIDNHSQICVLILHGYADTPYEFKHVAEEIATLGVDVHVPVLPHHGINSEELAKTNRGEIWTWLMHQIIELRQHYAKLILVGQSLGAGAAITAVTNGAKVDGLVVAAANSMPSTKVSVIMHLARFIHFKSFKTRYSFLQKIGFDPAYVAWKQAHFPRISLSVFQESLDELNDYVKNTYRINVPIMIIHGAKDYAMKVEKTSTFYFNNVSSAKKVTVIVEDTGHAVFFSPYFAILIKHVKSFLKDIVDHSNAGEFAQRIRIGKRNLLRIG
ncbi:MAG: dienelactone hydrolase family protein [Promethearchaeota archaeon CR_4]|nr:MAG: dienelactone hydrolase family protein [Candidatus Lokiarchaeota archaeon CR_4]